MNKMAEQGANHAYFRAAIALGRRADDAEPFMVSVQWYIQVTRAN